MADVVMYAVLSFVSGWWWWCWW